MLGERSVALEAELDALCAAERATAIDVERLSAEIGVVEEAYVASTSCLIYGPGRCSRQSRCRVSTDGAS